MDKDKVFKDGKAQLTLEGFIEMYEDNKELAETIKSLESSLKTMEGQFVEVMYDVMALAGLSMSSVTDKPNESRADKAGKFLEAYNHVSSGSIYRLELDLNNGRFKIIKKK